MNVKYTAFIMKYTRKKQLLIDLKIDDEVIFGLEEILEVYNGSVEWNNQI